MIEYGGEIVSTKQAAKRVAGALVPFGGRLPNLAIEMTMPLPDALTYRVMWRPHLTSRWQLIQETDTLSGAKGILRATLDKHGGFCRLQALEILEDDVQAAPDA